MSEVVAENQHASMLSYSDRDFHDLIHKMVDVLVAAKQPHNADTCVAMLATAILTLRGPLGCPSPYLKTALETILAWVDSQEKVQSADALRKDHVKSLIQ